jgi:hypothetical protein
LIQTLDVGSPLWFFYLGTFPWLGLALWRETVSQIEVAGIARGNKGKDFVHSIRAAQEAVKNTQDSS